MPARLDELIENFELIEDWDERYRYLIEIGRELEPLPESDRNEDNRVRGCASQVWLTRSASDEGAGDPILTFRGDSDAHIVRGLVALTLAVYSGHRASDILTTDLMPIFDRLGLSAHLTPQRSNGVRSMVERIKADARAVLSA